MKLLCFQAKRFRWKTHSKTLPEVADQELEQEVHDAVVAFLHSETGDLVQEREASILRQSIKHLKWLANKRDLRNIVLHSFTHLGGDTAEPAGADGLIRSMGERLQETGYRVWLTPFAVFGQIGRGHRLRALSPRARGPG